MEQIRKENKTIFQHTLFQGGYKGMSKVRTVGKKQPAFKFPLQAPVIKSRICGHRHFLRTVFGVS